MRTKKTTANSSYPKGAVSFSAESFVGTESSVLRIGLSDKNHPLGSPSGCEKTSLNTFYTQTSQLLQSKGLDFEFFHRLPLAATLDRPNIWKNNI